MTRGRLAARWIAALVLGTACAALAGCGAGTGELTGTVTYNSKPVRTGTVSVMADDGSLKSGTINDDGTYTVAGVPTGPVKVGVSSPDPRTIKVAQRKKSEPPPKADASMWFAIPPKYAEPKDSGLSTTVGGGKNDFPITLK